MVLAVWAAQVSDLSGTWVLNVQKSHWGKHPKPESATVTIEHHEPALKYSGKVVSAAGQSGEDGANVQIFTFEGAVDGKEYPATGALGPGTLAIRRVSPSTIASDYKSRDGTLTETAKTTISADGKVLVRDLHEKGPAGEMSWTEVYQRQ